MRWGHFSTLRELSPMCSRKRSLVLCIGLRIKGTLSILYIVFFAIEISWHSAGWDFVSLTLDSSGKWPIERTWGTRMWCCSHSWNKIPVTRYELKQGYLNVVASWAERSGLAVNPNTTELVLFTRRYKSQKHPYLIGGLSTSPCRKDEVLRPNPW